MDLTALLADPAAVGTIVGALALILFGAAWHKFSEPNAFLSSLAAYRLLPAALLDPAAKALPTIEVLLGIGLLVPLTRTPALVAVAALFLLYAGAMGVNLGRGRSYIDCGCGGAAHPLSWALVIRNAVLAGAALAVTGPTAERGFSWLDAITLVVGVLAFYMLYLMADELLRQASRMARVETSGNERS
ncbi:MAG: hypothetical protein KIT73_11210 [Burkholderiales bacterium]|nr:hypothetical protein [Burkholderiales bacterium]